MPETDLITLAADSDAADIAAMSRDLVEPGLTWAWTPSRVRHFIASRDTTVILTRRSQRVAAFALMHFGEDSAHLTLLAVAGGHRRQGLGRRLIEWLSESATTAGIFRIDLELRASNAGAQAFYRRLGFEELGVEPGYYQGREAALRMSRRLGRLT